MNAPTICQPHDESGPRRLLRDLGAMASLITAAVLVPLALSLLVAW